eukprot:gene5699-4062_t
MVSGPIEERGRHQNGPRCVWDTLQNSKIYRGGETVESVSTVVPQNFTRE